VSDLISRTARLVPYTKRPKHSASFVTAYVYEPEADEAGARLGNLYVVIEVLTSGRASEEVVDLVIQAAGDKYFNDPTDELDPLARFEAAIKQTNHELSEYVGRGNASWIGKLSAIIAVQVGDELHVSHTGSAEAFLYRGKAVSRISQPESGKPTTPSKTFSSIATGQLEVGDKFLLATPALIHQVPLAKLQTVIGSASPNAAIAELGQLLEGTSTLRIAAVVVDITTPELAALKVRSDEPNEIELGNRENFAEAALSVAAPLARSSAEGSKRAAQAARTGWSRLQPRLRRASLAAAAGVRRLLATSGGRRAAGLIVLIGIAAIGFSLWHSSTESANTKQFAAYQDLFQRYEKAKDTLATGDKATAHDTLSSVQTALTKLAGQESNINHQLQNQPRYQGEPATVIDFKKLVATALDELDGLTKVSPMTVAEIGGKSGRPEHLETDGAHAYTIDTGDHNAIAIINLLTGDQKDSKADASKLNDVLATTVSANNDGIFILTSKPSVWFYRFATDTLAEQTLAYGDWPKSRSIASYGPNLYLLGDSTVYKHVRNATGYSPKTDYISTTATGTKFDSLAVDGWIYLLSGTTLQRYLGSSLKQSANFPASLGTITNLRSVAGGDLIIGTSTKTTRIALWTGKNDQLAFSKQITVQGGKSLTDATYDSKTGRIFATLDNRLVSFPFKP